MMTYDDFTGKDLLCHAFYLPSGYGMRLYPQFVLENGDMKEIPEETRRRAFSPNGAIYVPNPSGGAIDRYTSGKSVLVAYIPGMHLRRNTNRDENAEDFGYNASKKDDFVAYYDQDIKVRPYQYEHSLPFLSVSDRTVEKFLKEGKVKFDNSDNILSESSRGMYFRCINGVVGPCKYSFSSEYIELNGGLESNDYKVKIYDYGKLPIYTVKTRHNHPVMSFVSCKSIASVNASNVKEIDYIPDEVKSSILLKCLETSPASKAFEITKAARRDLKTILSSHSVLHNAETRMHLFDEMLNQSSEIYSDLYDAIGRNIWINEDIAEKALRNLAGQKDKHPKIKKLLEEIDELKVLFINDKDLKSLQLEYDNLHKQFSEQSSARSAGKKFVDEEKHRKEIDSALARIEELEKQKQETEEELKESNREYGRLSEIRKQYEETVQLLKASEDELDKVKNELQQTQSSIQTAAKEFHIAFRKHLQQNVATLGQKINEYQAVGEELAGQVSEMYGSQFGQLLQSSIDNLINEVETKIKGARPAAVMSEEPVVIYQPAPPVDISAIQEEIEPDIEITELPVRAWNQNEDRVTIGKQIIHDVSRYLKCSGRETEDEDVTNYLVCLTQGFITTFAGKPGSGKTSLCNLLAGALGLTTNSNNTHFVEVSVGRGWSSHKDFVGFYNPITEKLVKSNDDVFTALSLSEKEDSENAAPMVIMLDEANLSPLEHYWSIFLKNSDFNSTSSRKINLGPDINIDIAPQLRFLATVNHDHTTEELSPRFLDRSWVILLDEPLDEIPSVSSSRPVVDSAVPYAMLHKAFGVQQGDTVSDEVLGKWGKVRDALKKLNLEVMGRSFNMVMDYVRVAQHYMQDETKALDYAVAQKILPSLSVFGSQYKQELADAAKLCNNLALMRCHKCLTSILCSGNMDVYQFFGH